MVTYQLLKGDISLRSPSQVSSYLTFNTTNEARQFEFIIPKLHVLHTQLAVKGTLDRIRHNTRMLVHLLTVGNKRTSILLTELQAYKFRAETSGTAKIIAVKVHN